MLCLNINSFIIFRNTFREVRLKIEVFTVKPPRTGMRARTRGFNEISGNFRKGKERMQVETRKVIYGTLQNQESRKKSRAISEKARSWIKSTIVFR